MTVTREGSRLIIQMTDQGPVEIHAAAEREFYPEGIDAQILFSELANGRAQTLTLNQAGQSWKGVRAKR